MELHDGAVTWEPTVGIGQLRETAVHVAPADCSGFCESPTRGRRDRKARRTSLRSSRFTTKHESVLDRATAQRTAVQRWGFEVAPTLGPPIKGLQQNTPNLAQVQDHTVRGRPTLSFSLCPFKTTTKQRIARDIEIFRLFHIVGVTSQLHDNIFLFWCTCVSASARQSRAQCCAREFRCKILICQCAVREAWV